MRNEIVVGLDGSRASAGALRWALAEAAVSGDSVVAMNAWTPVVLVSAPRSLVPAVVELPGEAEALVNEQLEAAGRALYPGVAVETVALEQAAVPMLLERARDARMLVVGTGHKSRLGRFMLGSISEVLAHEAACPVVVVPGAARTRAPGSLYTVVAGADGSPNADAALTWAAHESKLHDGVVEVYEIVDAAAGNEALGERVYLRRVTRHLEHVADRVRRDTDAKVMTQALVGKPGPSLCGAATAADLLVVGRRGRGGVAGLVMGSVADHCVRHADVPVAVIPTEATP